MKFLNEIISGLNRLDELTTSGVIRPQHVKEALHLPTGASRFLLESAARFGKVDPRYDVICPNCRRVVRSYNYLFEVPEHVVCRATAACEDKSEESVVTLDKVYVLK